jgi:TolB protein
VNDRLALDDLYAEAEPRFGAGDCVGATDRYRQVQQISVTFERDLIAGRLYDCYMQLGMAIVNHNPAMPEQMPVALDYFTEALSVRPRDPDAQTEQRLVSLYLAGRQSYESGRWSDAATQLGSVFDDRPGYMGDTLLDPLYDALIRYGDQMRDAQDFYLAWEQYRRAASLPVEDRTLAEGRMASVQPFLTPTATPSDTPTITPPPSATPFIPPTAVPSATPPAPLATYRNQIVFRSDKDGQQGLWVMNPDGSNRRYLGAAGALQAQFKELRAKEAFSPDGRFRAYTTEDPSRGDESPQIYYQGTDPNGVITTRRLTDFAEMSYDPVWSPDGSRIAYVSTVDRSDDIWVLNLDDEDGTKWNRTKLPNNVTWPWDKHPSWSPDSRKIAFWTNREGTKQIYVMDAEGRTQQNVSQVEWDEYDPIWVK